MKKYFSINLIIILAILFVSTNVYAITLIRIMLNGDELSIVMPYDKYNICIIDESGENKISCAFESSNCIIDVSSLAHGKYLVKLKAKQGITSFKVFEK